jgi:hypothetical protein
MTRRSLSEPLTLQVGTTSRPRLLEELQSGGVHLNASARTLLDDAAFDHPTPQSITVVQRSLKELGLAAGAPLPLVFEAAQDHGLDLCPADTGPYLRLAWRTQPNAPDAIMSNGRAPTGSVTVAASVLREDDEYPKGFYLRVIDHRLWLRGYRCDLAYAWDADDSFVFALPPVALRH